MDNDKKNQLPDDRSSISSGYVKTAESMGEDINDNPQPAFGLDELPPLEDVPDISEEVLSPLDNLDSLPSPNEGSLEPLPSLEDVAAPLEQPASFFESPAPSKPTDSEQTNEDSRNNSKRKAAGKAEKPPKKAKAPVPADVSPKPLVGSEPSPDFFSVPPSAPDKTFTYDRKAIKERHKLKLDNDALLRNNEYREGYVLAHGERIVRVYQIVNTGADDSAIVTNKRLIMDTRYKVEVPIEKVCGVRSAKYMHFQKIKFLFGLLFIAACIACCVLDFNKYFPDKRWLVYLLFGIGVFLGAVGLLMVICSFHRKFAINIFTDNMQQLIAYNSKPRKKDGDMLASVMIGTPGKDFSKFVREIGALLIQIKEER